MMEWIVAYGVCGLFVLLLWVLSRYAARVDGITYDDIDGGLREPYGLKFLLILNNKDTDDY